MKTARDELEALEKFVEWRERSKRLAALVCVETDDHDFVWTEYGECRPPESPGSVREWAGEECMILHVCPVYPHLFFITPATPDEAFAIRMRWG